MQEHLYRHFESECHSCFRDNASVILYDNTDGSNPTKRKTYWMEAVRDVWPQGIYPLAGHLQDLDFGMVLGRGIGHDLYDLVPFGYSVNCLSVTLGLHLFIYLLIYLFIYIF